MADLAVASRRSSVGPIVVSVLIAVVLVLYMGLWRGIWFDELLHFATGGMTFDYLVRTIDYTTIHVNHGQTGVYFVLDWILLQVFGASAIFLRAPSLVSALVLLVSAVLFLRAKGFGWKWQALAVIALGANESLMFYTGEARPYMPLAASAAAMLTFYALPGDDRRRWWARALGVFGFIFGAVIHPYWIFMWGLIAAFSLAVALVSDRQMRTLGGAWGFVAPAYVIPSLVLYAVVAQLTWMRRIINFGWDRDSIYSWPSLINAFLQDHFAFAPFAYPPRAGTWEIDAGVIIPTAIAAVAVLTAGWLVADRRSRSVKLVAPGVLLLIAGGSSIFASYLSYRSQYIIFERQWVAGMALTTIAWTWFFAEWWRNARGRSTLAALPALAFVALALVSFAISAATQAAVTVDRYHSWQAIERDTRSIDELTQRAAGVDYFNYEPVRPEQGYGYLASVNVARGGPVWEEFIRWYNSQAGMRQEFREQDVNWTDIIWPAPSTQSFLCLPERQWECPVPAAGP